MKHMEILRRKLVYELFIEQFIGMAQVSIKYRSLQQTMGLLKQAERLCFLLIDDKFTEEAEKHRSIVASMRETVQTMLTVSSQGPELPRRESLADKEAIKIRFRPEKVVPREKFTTTDGPSGISSIEEAPSDDDNDEIYNYHQSVIAQIHATSAENLARFQHMDENDDDTDELAASIERLEAKLDHSDYESDNETKL